MVKLNDNFFKLNESYLFSTTARKIREYAAANPDKPVIKMGIGDVTRPLIPQVAAAIAKAGEGMATKEGFHGYGDEQGEAFLQEAIKKYYLRIAGVTLKRNEIFISDGAKSDVANFTDLFSNDNIIVIPDPVYPVYLDSNMMLGRKIVFIEGNEANGFLPMPYEGLKGDIVYLCSPNNPTGAVYNRDQLKTWVDFANANGMIILFDAAYEAFISDSSLPRSIFEIEGARTCAVEFCSLSKTAGFTGTRCGYTVVPEDLVIDGHSLNKMWLRRQTTKYNGTSYVIQKGAEEVFSESGMAECMKNIEYYKENAGIMAKTMDELGIWYTGGINSPYIWLRCGMDSWEFFDMLLNEIQVAGTPGSGFGKCGEGYFRLTAFNTHENTLEAMQRFKKLLAK
ncbi:MAG TPA: LL-diaminopimelate aminotransferase [Candidatus Stercoripulliclostridium merdigallinarum]|uniref:LL-diaminopimelate aminotransferase n=1 Tax=Candidatus Stercoripulliclostridium merdigallinarum TaxID=2840951 RepID=A0A9D1SH50_9FIRM|nr:LL-diaminopimelate aminotransferase [Candidatus Stercoripulliclostridium merdigallinarum]